MAADDEIKTSDLFRALGLQEMDRGDVIVWRKIEQVEDTTQAKKRRKPRKNEEISSSVVVFPNSPWRINDIEIHERRNRLQLASLSVSLDEQRLVSRLEAGIKKHFGQRTTGQIVDASQGGPSWWCLLEFVRPGARDELRGYTPTAGNGGLPLGSAGFKFTLAHDGDRILVSLTDHFAMGYIPPEFVTGIPRFLAWAFGMESLLEFGGYSDAVRSIFEVSLSPVDVALIAGLHEPEKTSRGSLVHSAFPRRFWDQYLGVRSRLVREHLTNGGGFTSMGEGFGVKIVAGEGALRNLLGEPVPVEVLESREGGQTVKDLDLLILEGKTEKAAKLLESEVTSGQPSMLIARRAAMLTLQSVDWRLREKTGMEGWATSEHSNKLFLSAKLMRSLELGENSTGLETLSSLGERLMEEIPGADDHSSLDLVLPELLGDLWSGADVRTAAACYKRILSRRGDQPRVLRKLVALSRGNDDTIGEIEWLRRLIQVEQRKNELARIFLRLAELQSAVGDVPSPDGLVSEVSAGSEVLRCGLRALELDRTLHEAAIVVTDELVRQSRPLEAIHIVEQLLRETRGAISQKAEARLEARIGRVWLQSMNRPDLAEKRFETALQLDPSSQGALDDLEGVYRVSGRFEKLAAIYEAKLTRSEKSNDHLEAHRVLGELVSLYRGPLAQPRKALDLYFRILEGSSLNAVEIDRISAWEDVEVDWKYLHDSILNRVEKSESTESLGEIYCRLAQIARDRLGDFDLTASHYTKAFANGGIDSAGFRFLVDKKTASRDWQQVNALYELHLKKVSGIERADVIRELLTLPQGPSDERKDQLAVELARSRQGDAADIRPVLQRLEWYRKNNDVHNIVRLSELVVGSIDSGPERIDWLEHATRALMEVNLPSKYDPIDRNYRAMVAAGADQIVTFQSAVEYLCFGPNPKLAFPYAQRLVALHVAPRIPLEAAQDVFDGFPRFLAAFYSLVAEGTSDRDAATQLYRMAAAELKNAEENSEDSVITERLLGRICAHSLCESAELSQLHRLVSQSGNWPILARGIAKQVEYKESGKEKAGLLLWLAEIYRNELRDPARARSSYLEAFQYAEKKYLVKYSLATLEVAAANSVAAYGYIRDFLSDLSCLDDPRKVVSGVRILLDNSTASEKVKPLIKPLLEEAMARGLAEVAGEIGELLIVRGVTSLDLIESLFAGRIAAGKLEEAAGVWLKSFELLSSAKRTRVWLERTKSVLHGLNLENFYPKLLGTALSDEGNAKVGRRPKRELLVTLGLLLFETDGKRKKSLRVLQEAFVADPTDQRIWIPLYFVTQEFGTKLQRRRYLKSLISRVERDSRVLQTTPLTIESLRAELGEVSEGVDQNVVQRGLELPDPNAPAENGGPDGGRARLQNAEGMDFTNVFDAGAMLSVIKPLPLGIPAALREVGPISDQQPAESEDEKQRLMNDADRNIFGIPDQIINAEPGFGLVIEPVADFPLLSIPSFDDVPSVAPMPNEFALPLDANDAEAIPTSGAANGIENLSGITLDPSLVTGTGIPLPQFDESMPSLVLEIPDLHDVEVPAVPTTPPLPLLPALPDLPSGLNESLFKLDFTDVGVAVPGFGSEVLEKPTELQSQSVLDDLVPNPGVEPWMVGESGGLAANAGVPEGVFIPGAGLPVPWESPGPSEPANPQLIAKSEDILEGIGGRVEYSIVPLELPAAGEINSNSSTSSTESGVENSHHSDSGIATSALEVSDHTGAASQAIRADDEILDWRALVRENKVSREMLERASRQAFASEVEKHVALQVLAVVCGATDILQNWHWRVWRSPDEYGYPMAGRERFPDGGTPQMLGGSFHRLISALAPVLVKVHHDLFTLEGLARRLKISVQQIHKGRVPLTWDSGYLADAGFLLFAQRIQKRRFLAFHLPGLGSEVFYDGKERSIYFDQTYYKKKPQSAIFHKIQGISWAVKFQYFVPLMLDPARHVMPVAVETKNLLLATGIDKLKSKMGLGKNVVSMALDATNMNSIRPLIEKLPVDQRDSYAQLWDAMQQHVYRVKISETLDLIGVLEEITGKDLLAPGALSPGQIFRMSPHNARLIEFALKLKI